MVFLASVREPMTSISVSIDAVSDGKPETIASRSTIFDGGEPITTAAVAI